MDETSKYAIEKLIEINHIQQITMDKLPLKRKIGDGGQASVYKGIYEDKPVAVKVLNNLDAKCLAHEIVVMSNLNHPNIPKLHGVVEEDTEFILVFDFIEGQTLDQLDVSKFSDEQKFRMIKELASILEYIHSKGFIHRDLKPENLMLTKEEKIYLIDFGIAKVCMDEFIDTRAKGTLYYLAPEVFDVVSIGDDQQITSRISTKVDVWAYGCIVSWLFSGILPWCDKYPNNGAVIEKVLVRKKPFSIPSNITDEVVTQVIQMATVVDPNDRSTMADIRLLLENSGK